MLPSADRYLYVCMYVAYEVSDDIVLFVVKQQTEVKVDHYGLLMTLNMHVILFQKQNKNLSVGKTCLTSNMCTHCSSYVFISKHARLL